MRKKNYPTRERKRPQRTKSEKKEDQEMSETTPKSVKQTKKLPISDKRAKRNLGAGEDKEEKWQAAGSPAWVESRKRPEISILRRNKGKPPPATPTNPEGGEETSRKKGASDPQSLGLTPKLGEDSSRIRFQ